MPGISELALRMDGDAVIVKVKAVPGASRDKIAGILGDALKVATSAPAEKGKANQAIARTLAKALGVSPRAVRIVTGLTNPHKEFRINGLSAGQVRSILEALQLH